MGSGIDAELERIQDKKIDVAINESETIGKLLRGNGETAELNLDGWTLAANAQTYPDHGQRKLLTLRDVTTGDMVAYMDVGLNSVKRTAICSDRSLDLPADEATLNMIRRMGSCNEGFAVTSESERAGNLLMGLAIYTLGLEGFGTLEMREYIPNDDNDDDRFSDTGPQRANFDTKHYHGVTPEIRNLTAKALGIRVN